MVLHPIHSRSHNAVLLTRVKNKSAPFASTNTVYSIDDRIWLLMLERKKALRLEPEETRAEREQTQREEAEADEELQKIHRAIRYATEDIREARGPGEKHD